MGYMEQNEVNLQFDTVKQIGLSRVGELTTCRRRIQTPILWFGTIGLKDNKMYFHMTTRALKKIRAEAFLVNAYYLYLKKNSGFVEWIKSLNQHMALKVDSGGFQNQKKETILSINKIYETQKILEPDIVVQLDFPIYKTDSNEEKQKKVSLTLKALREYLVLNKKDNLSILPVIHGYSIDNIDYTLNKLRELLSSIPAIAIGGFVPLLKNDAAKNSFSGKLRLAEMIIHIKERLPNAFLHVLGTGSATTSLLYFLCGVDSFDQIGWILKAGFGQIQLIGHGDVFVRKIKKERFESEIVRNRMLQKILDECFCPICKKHGIEKLAELSTEGRFARLVHNAWTQQTQIKIFRKAVSEDEDIRNLIFSMASSPLIKKFLQILDRFLVKKGVFKEYFHDKGEIFSLRSWI
jgi:tRNA-guanine family transglycosylase